MLSDNQPECNPEKIMSYTLIQQSLLITEYQIIKSEELDKQRKKVFNLLCFPLIH
jgi:hypothetical protein